MVEKLYQAAFLSKGKNFYNNLQLIPLEMHHRLPHYRTIDTFLDSCDIVMTEYIETYKLNDNRFRECYISYRKLLEEEKYFDFSSIMHKFDESVRNDNSKLIELGRRVKHVTVDEYQDINKIQEILIEILSTGADSVSEDIKIMV